MSTNGILDRLESGDTLLLDGGTGSELQRRGIDVLKGATTEAGLQAWSATANIDAPEAVREVHGDYLRAGADIIISNNFWTSPTRMEPIGLGDRWEAYALAAGENAIAARDAVNPDAFVAGGIAPPCVQRRVGGTASDVDILGEEAYRREIRDHAKLLAGVGVDAVWVEYVGYVADCVAAADAGAASGLPVFLGVRHIREDGTMQYEERLEDLAASLEGRGVAGVLLMCTPPEEVSAGLPLLREAFDGCVGAYPNIGYRPLAPLGPAEGEETPDDPAEILQQGDNTPDRLADYAGAWRAMGAQIIGGCCATGPEHIDAMRPVVKKGKRKEGRR